MRFNEALELMCDNYCKKPDEIKNQDILDDICDNCPLVVFSKENLEQIGGVSDGR